MLFLLAQFLIGNGENILLNVLTNCMIYIYRIGSFVKHKLNIRAEAETIQEGVDDESSSEESSDEDAKKKKKGKDKVGFRDRKVRAVLT